MKKEIDLTAMGKLSNSQIKQIESLAEVKQRFHRVDNLALEMILRMLDHVGPTTFLKLVQIAIAYDLRLTKENRTEIDRLLDTLNESIIVSKDAYKGLSKAISNVEDYQRKVRGK